MDTWQIVAGISSILGIIGLIVYSMFKSQDNAINRDNITVEMIAELKKSNVSIEQLNSLNKKERKEFLENSTKISHSIIDKILVPQQNKRTIIALWFMILMFILAVISIGGWFFSSTTNNWEKFNNADTTHNKLVTHDNDTIAEINVEQHQPNSDNNVIINQSQQKTKIIEITKPKWTSTYTKKAKVNGVFIAVTFLNSNTLKIEYTSNKDSDILILIDEYDNTSEKIILSKNDTTSF